MSSWPTASLEELARPTSGAITTGPFGSSIKAENFVETGVPVIRGGNMVGRRLSEQDFVFLTEEKAHELSRAVVFGGDIVITHRGTLGQVVMIPHDGRFERYVISQSQMKVTLDASKASPEFVTYFLQSPLGQHRLLQNSAQTGVPAIAQPVASLRQVEVPVPPLREQRAIAEVLGALDDKIESNRRRWSLLQEIAAASFQRAVVQADHFIPLGDLYEVGLSGVWGDDEPSDSRPVATTCLRGRDLEDLLAGDPSTAPQRFISQRQLDPRKFKDGEIWTAGSGTLGPSLLMTEPTSARWSGVVTYSNFVKRLVPTSDHGHHSAAWLAVMQAWRNGDFANYRTGTAMPNLDAAALLAGVEVPELDSNALRQLDDLVKSCLDPQALLETDRLARLRDALLPELLSGRIRVPEAREPVEDAS